MKNFGSILAFLAISAGAVSARAVPNDNGVEARAPYPYVGSGLLYSREPKRGKKGKSKQGDNGDDGGTSIHVIAFSNDLYLAASANSTQPDAALSTGAAKSGKKGKKGKNAQNDGYVTGEYILSWMICWQISLEFPNITQETFGRYANSSKAQPEIQLQTPKKISNKLPLKLRHSWLILSRGLPGWT